MARPTKFTDADKRYFKRSPRANDRLVNTRELRQRILIVTEGEATEPNYFRAYERKLPRGVAEIEITGLGANTLSLVERAEAIRNRLEKSTGRGFDQVWVVFDRDSFQADNFDNAISKAKSHGIRCAWSNEAFELWFVLHFEDRQSAMSRDEYEPKLSKWLGVKYQKNASDILELLGKHGDQNKAIERASRLCREWDNSRTPPSKANPCTHVHELVQELDRFRQHKVA